MNVIKNCLDTPTNPPYLLTLAGAIHARIASRSYALNAVVRFVIASTPAALAARRDSCSHTCAKRMACSSVLRTSGTAQRAQATRTNASTMERSGMHATAWEGPGKRWCGEWWGERDIHVSVHHQYFISVSMSVLLHTHIDKQTDTHPHKTSPTMLLITAACAWTASTTCCACKLPLVLCWARLAARHATVATSRTVPV